MEVGDVCVVTAHDTGVSLHSRMTVVISTLANRLLKAHHAGDCDSDSE